MSASVRSIDVSEKILLKPDVFIIEDAVSDILTEINEKIANRSSDVMK